MLKELRKNKVVRRMLTSSEELLLDSEQISLVIEQNTEPIPEHPALNWLTQLHDDCPDCY
jgi:hypothetical protein